MATSNAASKRRPGGLMDSLELEGRHIAELGDEDLRTLVTKLCEAELQRNGLPASAILAGGNQTAADGGIDVSVQLETTTPALDFVLRPQTGFQVKCEDMPEGKIGTEMRPRGVLREAIGELIAAGGAYVIVSSKGTVSQQFLNRRLKAMREAVSDQPGADSLKLDFYDRERLARWVRQYPAVEMWVRGKVGAALRGWQGYGPWAGSADYILDDTARLVERTAGGVPTALPVAAGIGRLRQLLGTPGQVGRLVGLSGTGKTRLVQALFESGVGTGDPLERGRLLYTDVGHSPDPNARDMLLRLGEAEQRTMVIVDNCNPATHSSLREVVGRFPIYLSLLTVEYDVADDDAPEATDVFELAPSSSEVLDSILRRLAPQLDGVDRRRIAEFSGGNARIGLALARTVAKGEALGTLNDGELFKRLFMQGQADDKELLRAAEVCSLVYSFEGEDAQSDSSELRVLGSLVGMSGREMYRHVSALRQRDLVQSRSKWRALLPPALANRLARSALRNIPTGEIVDAFNGKERLLISFTRRLEYLHDNDDACALAERWMADKGWLANPQLFNLLGIKLFCNLAPLSPSKALASLERAIHGDGSSDFASRQQTNLSQWSALLWHLAYEPAAFDTAATLLLTLAELNTTTFTNCRDAWREPFRIALSGTMALPPQRMAFLKRLLATSSGRRHELVLDAVEATLMAENIGSSHDFTFGARSQGYGWEPATQAEVQDWYVRALELLRLVEQSGPEGRQWALSALARRFRELWNCGMHKQLSVLASQFAASTGWPAGWVAVRNTLRFDAEDMPGELVSGLRELDVALAPSGLAQEVRIYALGQAGSHFDLADVSESTEDEEEPLKAWQRTEHRAVTLGEALSQDDAAFQDVLLEFFRKKHGRQFLLGQGLGQGSKAPLAHWNLLRDAYVAISEDRSVEVLVGFVHGLKAANPTAHAAILNALPEDEHLDAFYPHFIGMPSGNADGERLLAALKRGVAKPHSYTLRTNLHNEVGLPLNIFCTAATMLSSMANGGLAAAMNELSFELHSFRADPSAIPAEIIELARTLLGKFSFEGGDNMTGYRINELAKIAFSGTDASEAAAALSRRFADAVDDYRTHSEDYGELACTLFKLQPAAALDSFLAKPSKRKHFGFRSRFVARHGPVVQCSPESALMDWVAVDPATRAPLVAAEITIVAHSDDGATTLSPLARRLLDLLPDKTAVLQGFSTNFHPSHWSGSIAQTLNPFVALTENLAASADPVVAAWATEALSAMRRRIENDGSWESMREESFE